MKLNDQMLVLLIAAARREDRMLVLPERVSVKAAAALRGKLLRAGLVEALPVAANSPAWEEAEDGAGQGLRITAAGLAAIGIEDDAEETVAPAGDEDHAPAAAAVEPARLNASSSTVRRGRSSRGRSGAGQVEASAARPAALLDEGSRRLTKRQLLIDLLARREGATIADLTEATGWLPHTTRAALTGLRKRGYRVAKDRNAAGVTAYRIEGEDEGRGSVAGDGDAGNGDRGVGHREAVGDQADDGTTDGGGDGTTLITGQAG